MVVLKRVAKGLLLAALAFAVLLLLSTCRSEPVAGDQCGRADLWNRITLDNGDVLECQPQWGSADRQMWTLVGHIEPSGSLVWFGVLAAAVGASLLAVGLVGIFTARRGQRRVVRRLE